MLCLLISHKWEEIQRTLIPGYQVDTRGFSGSLYALQTLMESMQSKTSILSKCARCGEFKTTDVVGDFTHVEFDSQKQ